jgi:cob(I)alamin adenosyltransferase
MPLYTGTGDHGETGLFGNRRVPKDHLRIEAYGTIDELNCLLGLLRSEPLDPDLAEPLQQIQATLFEVGADLATEGGKASLPQVRPAIATSEGWIDRSEAELAPLRTFILPGGHREAALLHLCRAVCRRAERRFWTLYRETAGAVPEDIGIWLNRLSDLFFSWARRANRRRGIADVPWERR